VCSGTLTPVAHWSGLRRRLDSVEDSVTIDWGSLNELVGGLPPSAYRYSAFWSGQRSSWSGFTTRNVRVGQSVTFVRARHGRPAEMRNSLRSSTVPPWTQGRKCDVVLVGCVKQKLDRSAPARDLYISTLFRKERAYAEAVGAPWFILSAEHGLVAPDDVLEPYERALASSPAAYRDQWGQRIVDQLVDTVGPVSGLVVEVHAGAAYCDPICGRLTSNGATVIEPLHGLGLGQRLAWYSNDAGRTPSDR
jgi:hypothetical protein